MRKHFIIYFTQARPFQSENKSGKSPPGSDFSRKEWWGKRNVHESFDEVGSIFIL
jgi:hypothetical protein